MNEFTAIILAAGKGTRFKSELPKVLHKLHNKPMIHYVIESVHRAYINSVCVVVGHKKELVEEACDSFNTQYAIQDQQLGTGHAVVCALNTIKQNTTSHCIVLAGDCPLIQPKTIKQLLDTHLSSEASATVLSAKIPDAGQYGRIIRDNKTNNILAIREAKDCSPDELKIQEFNSGIYCFNTSDLQETIQKLSTNNSQGEYYLTDVIEFYSKNNQTVSGLCIDNEWEVSGANTQEELNEMAQFVPQNH